MSHWVTSSVSSAYRAFRPEYPRALFQGLLGTALASAGSSWTENRPFTVVDLGCGTGQATYGIADVLTALPAGGQSAGSCPQTAVIIGIDPSATQVAEASRAATEADAARYRDAGVSIKFTQGSAETLHACLKHDDAAPPSTVVGATIGANLAAGADLVMSAQAAHWMDIPSLCSSLAGGEGGSDRTDPLLRQGGILALISYPTSRLSVVAEPLDSPYSLKADALLQALDTRLMEGDYWPPERAHLVEPNVYSHIRHQIDAFPHSASIGRAAPLPPHTSLAFTPLPRREYRERRTLSVEHLMKYLGTWSGVNRYVAATGDAAILKRDVEEPLRRILEEATEGVSDSPHTDLLDVTFTFYLDMWRRN